MSIRVFLVADALALLVGCGGTGAAPAGASSDASGDSTLAPDGVVELGADAPPAEDVANTADTADTADAGEAADARGAADAGDAADASVEAAPWSAAWPDGSAGCTTFVPDGAAGNVPTGDAGVTTVATDAGSILTLAVDDTTVYWTDESADVVMKAPLAGGPAEVVADTGTPSPTWIVLDATYVYWVSRGGQRILRCPKDATHCTPFVVGAPFPNVGQIALDSRNVYFTDSTGGRVLACSINGCRNQPTVIASGLYLPYEVAVDCTNLYWVNWVRPAPPQVPTSTQIVKCAIGGCGNTPTVLATDPDPGHLVIDSNNVYWNSWAGGNGGYSILKCAIDGCGGKPDVLQPSIVDDGGNGDGLDGPLTDGIHVFFTDWNYPTGVDRLLSCPVSGCMGQPTVLFAGFHGPPAIALGARVVVAAGSGQILAIPR